MPPTASSPSLKPRPYRRLLTSALHTRFVRAVGISLLWSLGFAGIAGDWYSSVSAFAWAFFPLGPAGIKAILFSFTTICVYFLQITYLKIGKRTTASKWKSTRIILTSSATYFTFFWYLISAWWFTQVFVFTSPTSSDMSWVINGGYGAPDRLNERPIYLTTFFLLLALIQAGSHIYHDECAIAIPASPLLKLRGGQTKTSGDDSLIAVLTKRATSMIARAGFHSLIATALSPFAYSWVFRHTLWNIHLTLAKAFAEIPRSEANPPSSFYIGSVMIRALFFGVLLSTTWQFTLVVFSVYITSAPIKAQKSLSTYSKDPNGTLLNGLVTKKDLVKTFAFWEFDIISREPLPHRRKDIFGDFERMDQPPLFISMLNASLAVIRSIQTRITELDPATKPAAPPINLQGGPPTPDPNIHRLPKLLPAAVPAKSPIFQIQPPTASDSVDRLGRFVSEEARSIGSSKNPWSPPVDRTKQLAIEYASPVFKEARARVRDVQQSPFGRYFITHPIRLIQSTILGYPNANAALTVHALSGLSGFLVKSIDEDLYGKAVAGVPETVITLTKTIFAVEKFVQEQTGGMVTQADAKELVEVVLIHQSLKTCLREITTPFQHFLVDVGLSIRELNEAKSAAEDRPLFEVLAPIPKTVNPITSAPPKDSTKQMEEVRDTRNPRSLQSGKRRENIYPSVEDEQDEEPRQRSSQVPMGKQKANDADLTRPGRLFDALDKGSAYNTMRERQKKQQVSKTQRNEGLTRRSSGTKDKDAGGNSAIVNGNASGNVFGARDFNTLPAGGLDRRRVGEVR